MDPIVINVNVGLQESTLEKIGKIFTAFRGPRPEAPSTPSAVAQPRPAVPPKPEAPKEEPKAAPAPEAPAAPEIDNMTLNQAVKAAQGRGVLADTIRALFGRYGIKSSRDCPADKRAGLLTDLNALVPEDMPE